MRAVIASINFSRTAPFLLELSIQRHDSKPWRSYEDIIRSAQTCHLAGWSLLGEWWSIAAAHTPQVEIESTNLAVDSTMTLMNNEFRQTNFSIQNGSSTTVPGGGIGDVSHHTGSCSFYIFVR